MVIALAIPFAAPVSAQQISRQTFMDGSIVRAVTSQPPGSFSEGELVMVTNRAKVFGDRVSGSLTRYFVANDNAIARLRPEEIAQRLTPAPAGNNVRRFESVVELRKPVTVVTKANQPVYVGTAIFSGGARAPRTIEVRSSITATQIKVIIKP